MLLTNHKLLQQPQQPVCIKYHTPKLFFSFRLEMSQNFKSKSQKFTVRCPFFLFDFEMSQQNKKKLDTNAGFCNTLVELSEDDLGTVGELRTSASQRCQDRCLKVSL